MTKIQIDLNKEEDNIVNIYKAINNIKNKEDAIKKMIKTFIRETKTIKLDKK
jgi:hypothetical protein